MNLENAFGVHAKALLMRSARAELLASNMANTDTPNYKAKDFDFNQAMQAASTSIVAMSQSDRRHLGNGSQTRLQNAQLQFRVPAQPTLDGNTVDPDIERSEFMENAIMYQTSLRFLNGRISGLLTAIRGE